MQYRLEIKDTNLGYSTFQEFPDLGILLDFVVWCGEKSIYQDQSICLHISE